jgi:hypothetical protein
MRERKEPVPPEDALEVAKRVKEMYSYVCPDLGKEFAKFDEKPDKFFKQFQGMKVCCNTINYFFYILFILIFKSLLEIYRCSLYM